VIVTEDRRAERGFGALRQFFRLLTRHKLLVVLPIIIGIVGGNLIFVMTPKHYVATAVVALDVRKVTVAPMDMVVSQLPQEHPALKTELDILASRSMAESVIQRLGTQTLAPPLAPTARSISDSEKERQALVDRLIDGLQVSNDGRSYTIYISFTASDPVFAAKIANSYAEEYFARQTMVKLNAVRAASEWLGKKVEELRRKLDASERASDDFKQKNLNEVQREVAANRFLYEGFLKRYKATIEQEDLASTEAQLISEAQPPNRPSTPKLLPFMALGIFLGAATGISTAFLWEHFDDRIWSAATLEERSELPVLGALPSPRWQAMSQPRWLAMMLRWLATRQPRWLATRQPRWLAMRSPRWLAMMSFQHPAWSADADYGAWLQRLQAVLRFSPATRDAKVIAVTSALQGEGKTFVSIALARAFAATGASALVIGADLHRPALAERLHLKASFSWGEALAGKKSIDDIVQQDQESNISVIAADASQVAPMALFTAPAFEDLIASLRERYDRIIIDTPPVAASADTAMLGAIADVTILVVRWRATTYTAVVEALRQMALYSLPVAGIVLNQLDPRATARYAPSPRRVASREIAALRTPPQKRQAPRFIAVRGSRDQAKPATTDMPGSA